MSTSQQQNAPPMSEWIVVKALYTNPNHLVQVAEQLDVRDFTYRPFVIIYNAIKRLVATNTVVNAESILALLQANAPSNYAELVNIGGANAIDTLYDASYKEIVSLDEHIHTIREQSDNRQIGEAVQKLKAQIEQGVSNEEAMDEFDKAIQSIRLRGKQKSVAPIGTGVNDLLNRIVSNDDSVLGTSIDGKYPKINKLIRRIQKRRVTVFLSNYKSGKSSILLELGWYLASECGQPVLYGDTELFSEEVQTRLLAKISGFPMEYILSGLWNGHDEHRNIILNAAEKIKNTPFMWVNVNHMSRSQIVSLVKLSQLKYGITTYIHDYIKPEVENVDARVDLAVGAKVDMLKEHIAKSCDVAVLSAVQMNGNTGKVANSQEVERLADNVVILRPVEDEDDMPLATHVLKLKTSRYTESGGTVGLNVNFSTQQVMEV